MIEPCEKCGKPHVLIIAGDSVYKHKSCAGILIQGADFERVEIHNNMFPTTKPKLNPCKHGKNLIQGEAKHEVHVFRGERMYRIHCSCGHCSKAYTELNDAIEEWNSSNPG